MKTKHAKGPDGQPLVAFNSGRGRGRPKKNTTGALGGYKSNIEPTSDDYLKTLDKFGGPCEPSSGFKEVYTEIFVKRGTAIQRNFGMG